MSCLGLNISFYEFITENGANRTIFRVFRFFATLLGVENSRKEALIHNWNCCESYVTNIITRSIFSSNRILRFYRAKNDP